MEGMEAKLDELASMIERLPLLTSCMENFEAKLEDFGSMIETERRTRTLENLEFRSALDELKCSMEDVKTYRVFTNFTKSFRDEIDGRIASSEKSIREQLHCQLELLEGLLGEVKNRNVISQVHDNARPRSPSPTVRDLTNSELVASTGLERCFSETQLRSPRDANAVSKSCVSALSPRSVVLPIDAAEQAKLQRVYATQSVQALQQSPRRSHIHQVQRSQSGIVPRSPRVQVRQVEPTIPEASVAAVSRVQRFHSCQSPMHSPMRPTVVTARVSPLATPRVILEERSAHWNYRRQ